VTMDWYGHLYPDTTKVIVAGLERMFDEAREATAMAATGDVVPLA
jgi:hypothetical protein